MLEDRAAPPTGRSPTEIVAAAGRLADEVLYPDALLIDRTPVIPAGYLDAIAARGLYGLFGPVEAGGLEADATTAARVIEHLAGGSLTAAFVWIQHHSAVRAATSARPTLRDHWLGALCSGRVRAGVALGALRRPGPPQLTARPVGGGWLLDGSAPWITGWDRIGVMYVGARHGDDIVWALVEPRAGDTLAPRPVELAAVASSSTVTVTFTGHPVPDHRVVGVEPFADWRLRDGPGLRTNGYLAIGVAARCARLLGDAGLDADVAATRDVLDRSEGSAIVTARADATMLATRAATMLVVAGGGDAVDLDHHAQRLYREAMFLLVFGQTRDIRAAQTGSLRARR
jgi:alkylation response protein AidB-like acyl-CoA dehydrogenase